jgi:hypothetical protein
MQVLWLTLKIELDQYQSILPCLMLVYDNILKQEVLQDLQIGQIELILILLIDHCLQVILQLF